MKQILLEDVPKTGTTFIEIHNFAGSIWSQTYRYNANSVLESYCEAQDEWLESSTVLSFDDSPHHTYYVID